MRPAAVLAMLILVAGALAVPGTAVADKADNGLPIPYVESPQLAKLILRPEPKTLQINRDPFKPLIIPKKAKPGVPGGPGKKDAEPEVPIPEIIQKMELIGVVKLEGEFRAYVKTVTKTGTKTGTKTMVLRMQDKVPDKIEDYTVEFIGLDQIVLKSPHHEVVKKRGKK